MFQLTVAEWKELITNCDNLGAIKINISIMRAFVRMREIIDENKELRDKLDALEARYDEQFKIVFEAIRELIITKQKPVAPIGFKISKQIRPKND